LRSEFSGRRCEFYPAHPLPPIKLVIFQARPVLYLIGCYESTPISLGFSGARHWRGYHLVVLVWSTYQSNPEILPSLSDSPQAPYTYAHITQKSIFIRKSGVFGQKDEDWHLYSDRVSNFKQISLMSLLGRCFQPLTESQTLSTNLLFFKKFFCFFWDLAIAEPQEMYF
jgi:hypothetical protein